MALVSLKTELAFVTQAPCCSHQNGEVTIELIKDAESKPTSGERVLLSAFGEQEV